MWKEWEMDDEDQMPKRWREKEARKTENVMGGLR